MGFLGFGKKKEKKLAEEPVIEQSIEDVKITEEEVVAEEIVEIHQEPEQPEEVYVCFEEEKPEPKPRVEKPKKEVKPKEEKGGFFKKIFRGLGKTASAIGDGIASIFTSSELDDDFYEDLLAVLVQTDMGIEAAEDVIDDIKRVARKSGIKTTTELKEALANSISEILGQYDVNEEQTYPQITMIVGVNGVGKTTSIGKIAALYKSQKKQVLVAAADTFRAAATEQLNEWTNRAGVRIVKHGEGADPAAVVFDALSSAKAKKDDVIIVDTAGRLHNKAHLIEELKKIDRVVERNYPEASYRKLLVLDATTGQNALAQVEIFNDAIDLDGVILTKLDGTAKGGVVIAIKRKFNLPVLYVGVGEQIDDLLPFDSRAFARAIVGLE
ncbi:MAG: signal recognition particle-docking protein FtsY [Firmicutes bacterium]|nr:signal recognition particle-docking protein FtsY [Bacillota bacterium]